WTAWHFTSDRGLRSCDRSRRAGTAHAGSLRVGILDIARAVLDAALGFLFGAVGGLFGIGGGLIAIPMLGIFYGFDQQHAQGTAMVMVAPNVLIGLYQYRKRSGLDMRLAAILALSGIAFMYLGARVATHVPSTPLRIAFASFQVALFASTLWPRSEAANG